MNAELLAKMPQSARDAFALALDAKDRSAKGEKAAFAEMSAHVGKALDAVGIPQGPMSGPVHPLPSAYDETQRAALAYTAIHDLGTWPYLCPQYTVTRRRWLGIDPPGLLETIEVEVERDGVKTTEPLWRALQMKPQLEDVIRTLDALPLDTLLRVVGELGSTGGGYRISVAFAGMILPETLRVFRDLKDEGRAWAVEQADAFPTDPMYRGATIRAFIFLALVRANVPIEPKWDHLFPNVMRVTKELLFECARALPEERRAAVLATHIASLQPPLDWLTAFPYPALAEAWLAAVEPNSNWWNQRVELLRKLGEQHAAIRDVVERVVAATPKPMLLYVTRMETPKTASELSPLEREQLRIAGRGWDEQDLDAEARLAGSGDESSFRGFFEIRNIADAKGNPAYDALLF
ncbi:MAG: hypothetical protein ACXVCJ_29090, partial [Polyangiales bacterium]